MSDPDSPKSAKRRRIEYKPQYAHLSHSGVTDYYRSSGLRPETQTKARAKSLSPQQRQRQKESLDQNVKKYPTNYESDLTDAEWELIEPTLPGRKNANNNAIIWTDLRAVVNAILFMKHTGCSHYKLPADFPPHKTVQTWVYKLRKAGLFDPPSELFTLMESRSPPK